VNSDGRVRNIFKGIIQGHGTLFPLTSFLFSVNHNGEILSFRGHFHNSKRLQTDDKSVMKSVFSPNQLVRVLSSKIVQ